MRLPEFCEPCKTFLGHSSNAHEDADCRSGSERAGFHTVVTSSRLPCSSNWPQARSCGPPPCFRNPKGEGKASSEGSKKRAIGWIFKHVLGHTSLGLPKRKMRILPPGPVSSLTHSVPIGSKNVPDRPRRIRSLLQRKRDGTDVWMSLWVSLWVWDPSSLGTRAQGLLPLTNDLQASAFQPCVTLSPQAAREAIFLGARKGSPRECFQASILEQVFHFSDVRPPGLIQGPKLQSQSCVSPCTFQALQTHS